MKRQQIYSILGVAGLALAVNVAHAQNKGAGSGHNEHKPRKVEHHAPRHQDRLDNKAKSMDREREEALRRAQRSNGAGEKQQRTQEQEVFGRELMSVQERNEYQEKLRMIDSADERGKFIAQHREKMEQRAKSRGVSLDESETEESE